MIDGGKEGNQLNSISAHTTTMIGRPREPASTASHRDRVPRYQVQELLFSLAGLGITIVPLCTGSEGCSDGIVHTASLSISMEFVHENGYR